MFLIGMSYSHMPYNYAYVVAMRFDGLRCYTRMDGVRIVTIYYIKMTDLME